MRPMIIERREEPPVITMLVLHQRMLAKAYRLGRKGRGVQFNPYSKVTEPTFHDQWECGYRDASEH